jgi:hypothetical protein
MSRLTDCKGPHMRRCRRLLLPRRLRRTRESRLSIFVFERPEATGHAPQVQVLKQQSECWLDMDSASEELRMLRLFRMTVLVGLVVGAVAGSSILWSFSLRPTLPRFGS